MAGFLLLARFIHRHRRSRFIFGQEPFGDRVFSAFCNESFAVFFKFIPCRALYPYEPTGDAITARAQPAMSGILAADADWIQTFSCHLFGFLSFL